MTTVFLFTVIFTATDYCFLFFIFQRLAQNSTGHLTAKQFQDLFDVLDGRGARRRHRPAMSYVENPLLRRIQILVSNRCFDYAGDFMAAINVLLVSVSILATCNVYNTLQWRLKVLGHFTR